MLLYNDAAMLISWRTHLQRYSCSMLLLSTWLSDCCGPRASLQCGSSSRCLLLQGSCQQDTSWHLEKPTTLLKSVFRHLSGLAVLACRAAYGPCFFTLRRIVMRSNCPRLASAPLREAPQAHPALPACAVVPEPSSPSDMEGSSSASAHSCRDASITSEKAIAKRLFFRMSWRIACLGLCLALGCCDLGAVPQQCSCGGSGALGLFQRSSRFVKLILNRSSCLQAPCGGPAGGARPAFAGSMRTGAPRGRKAHTARSSATTAVGCPASTWLPRLQLQSH